MERRLWGSGSRWLLQDGLVQKLLSDDVAHSIVSWGLICGKRVFNQIVTRLIRPRLFSLFVTASLLWASRWVFAFGWKSTRSALAEDTLKFASLVARCEAWAGHIRANTWGGCHREGWLLGDLEELPGRCTVLHRSCRGRHSHHKLACVISCGSRGLFTIQGGGRPEIGHSLVVQMILEALRGWHGRGPCGHLPGHYWLCSNDSGGALLATDQKLRLFLHFAIVRKVAFFN